VRLTALKEAPYAFGSTWENEKDKSELDWRDAVNSRARFVAELDGQVVGMAAVGEAGISRVASLTSLWVDPRARGKGVGDSLVLAAIAWATDAGHNQLLLWVTDGNAYAERLYERHGFRRTGDTQQVRLSEDRLECEMSLRFS
jgi:GNAT superfamily N-acetyltransferase